MGSNRLASTDVLGGEPTAASPWWLDVPSALTAPELIAILDRFDVGLSHDGARAFLAGQDRPEPQNAHLCGNDRVLRFWGFGASVERLAGADGVVRVVAVSLQPVGLLLSERLVVSCRHAGVRFPIGDVTSPQTPAPALALDRLAGATNSSLVSLLRSAPPFDCDALLFGLLAGLVNTLFEARAALGTAKILCDDEYFSCLIQLRREAAISDVRSEHVARAAREATHLVDRTRRSLSAMQRVAVPFRQWFDHLKPPGLPDKTSVWLPNTKHTAASEYLVERIYKVRNDLQVVRREVHQSMDLLASADTGSQLLAVRALLDRTESVRNAVVVAGSITILLASAGLSAAVATIPSTNAQFRPLARALAYTGITVLMTVVVGVAVALMSRLAAPKMRSVWVGAACMLFFAAVAGLVLATSATGMTRVVLIGGGVTLAIASLLVAAYTGDFGLQRRRPVLTPAITALMAEGEPWSGTPAEFADALRRVVPASRLGLPFHRRANRIVARTVSEWSDDPAALELILLDEQLQLHRKGFDATFANLDGVVTVRSTGKGTGND